MSRPTGQNTNVGQLLGDIRSAIESFADFTDSGNPLVDVALRNGKIIFTSNGFVFSVKGDSNSAQIGLADGTTLNSTPHAANVSAELSGSHVILDASAKQQVAADLTPANSRGTLSSDVSLQFAVSRSGGTVQIPVTISAASAAANGNVWDLAATVQSALHAAGASEITVQVNNGRLLFTSANPFTVAASSNGILIGLNQPAYSSALSAGGKLYLGGIIKSYERIESPWRNRSFRQ